jgi:hypothetical protein
MKRTSSMVIEKSGGTLDDSFLNNSGSIESNERNVRYMDVLSNIASRGITHESRKNVVSATRSWNPMFNNMKRLIPNWQKWCIDVEGTVGRTRWDEAAMEDGPKAAGRRPEWGNVAERGYIVDPSRARKSLGGCFSR